MLRNKSAFVERQTRFFLDSTLIHEIKKERKSPSFHCQIPIDLNSVTGIVPELLPKLRVYTVLSFIKLLFACQNLSHRKKPKPTKTQHLD